MKRCTGCGEEKPATEEHFYRRANGKPGLLARCKPCRIAEMAAHRAAHLEEERARDRAYYARNRETCRRRAAERRRANPEAKRAARLRADFNMSLDDFDSMLEAQGGRCASCGNPEPAGQRPWHVDHDHSCCPGRGSCGKCIRGILCAGCNVAIGHAKDNPAVLRAAADYLERFKGQPMFTRPAADNVVSLTRDESAV